MNLRVLFAVLSVFFVVVSGSDDLEERSLSCPITITESKGPSTGSNTVWNIVLVNSANAIYEVEYSLTGTNIPAAWSHKVDSVNAKKTKTLKPSFPNSVVVTGITYFNCKISLTQPKTTTTTGSVTTSGGTTGLGGSSTTTGSATGSVGGDPDFVGFGGEHFRFSGEPGYYFNLISSKDLQVNGFFDRTCDESPHGTVITQMAVKINDHEILLDLTTMGTLDGAQIGQLVNGVVTPKDYILDDESSLSRPWPNNFDFITRDFNISMNRHIVDFSIQKPGMVFWGSNCQIGYFNMKITGMRDGLDVHGLLGQTAHHRHSEKNFQHPLSHIQGEGEIEGVEQDYIVNSPFGNDFSFNRNVHRV